MSNAGSSHVTFLRSLHPFDALSTDQFDAVCSSLETLHVEADTPLYGQDEPLRGLFIIVHGEVEVRYAGGERLAALGTGGMFGTRALVRGSTTTNSTRSLADSTLLVLPADRFGQLMLENARFAAHFDRPGRATAGKSGPSIADGDLTTTRLADIMTPDPVTIPAGSSVTDAARVMRDRDISCVLVVEDGKLGGILTAGDIANRVVAEGMGGGEPVDRFMTRDPFTLPSTALGFDAFIIMTERRCGHLPVVDDGQIVGILTRTNIIRRRSISAVAMIAKIAKRKTLPEIRDVVGQIPRLLTQLASAGTEPQTVGRLISGVADATTRRLLRLAEADLGAPPVPYLWAACGSQGRMEQTGVSDQDNCLIIDDAFVPDRDGAYFTELAKRVCDGLNACGYVYCPGEMMAITPRWMQKLSVWKEYFAGWIDKPDPMAQMLSSVMFDLRAIRGDGSLLEELQRETMAKARANTIFMAHLTANSLKHAPPLGLFGGLSVPRTGEHKGLIDLKHSGVVPIVDLGRIYALKAGVPVVNTRMRLEAARDARVISASGAADLIDAFDLICEVRLRHQARKSRLGQAIDNFLDPHDLSELERGHLRDAFVVVKTMQSAVGQGQHMMG
ncbi:MAG: putative nucleotidyltransferase substrate binding domain-containing protein [Geminicoccaceae bacterium]